MSMSNKQRVSGYLWYLSIRKWNGFSQECDFGPLNDLNPGMVNPGASESKTRSIKAAEFFILLASWFFNWCWNFGTLRVVKPVGKPSLCFGDSGCILLFRSNHLGNRMRIGNRQRSHPSRFSSGIWWKNRLKCPGFQRFQYLSSVPFVPPLIQPPKQSNENIVWSIWSHCIPTTRTSPLALYIAVYSHH